MSREEILIDALCFDLHLRHPHTAIMTVFEEWADTADAPAPAFEAMVWSVATDSWVPRTFLISRAGGLMMG